MTKPMSETKIYRALHSKLTAEVKSTPEPSGDDETFLMVAGTQSAVMGILGLRDDLLIPYLNDLIHISRAINQRVASMKD